MPCSFHGFVVEHVVVGSHLVLIGSHLALIGNLSFAGILTLGVGHRDLSIDLLAIRSSDCEQAIGAHLNFLVFCSVENLEDILAKVVSRTSFHRSTLKEHLDVSQLGEIEVSFLIKSVILESKLLHSLLKLTHFCSASSGRGHTASSWHTTSSSATSGWSRVGNSRSGSSRHTTR